MIKADLKEQFHSVFGLEAEAMFFSPGRINLIGEHTDYNGGHVFPAAITLGTYGAARKRADQTCRFYSENFSELGVIAVDLNNLAFDKKDNWTNYAKGVIKYLKAAGHRIDTGFDLYVKGTIPNGSGLSSSASLELLVGIVCETLYELDLARLDLVKIGKETENNFIGVNSGIMDQFSIGMGADEKAIYLDTNTLDYALVPLELGDYQIVIMNTTKRRELADSKYNQRRSECEKALEELQKGVPITSLGDLDDAIFDQYAYLIKDGIRIKRARHAVSENQRTLKALEALQAGKLDIFGRLMNASHVSLEHDYDVTGIELDTLVHTAWEQEGVLGARMTGAGFGGCAIAIVDKKQVESFKKAVEERYQDVIGYKPEFYIAEVAQGAHLL